MPDDPDDPANRHRQERIDHVSEELAALGRTVDADDLLTELTPGEIHALADRLDALADRLTGETAAHQELDDALARLRAAVARLER
jgi:hypothetical protein